MKQYLKKPVHFTLNIGLALSLIVVLVETLTDKENMQNYATYGAYYIILALVGTWFLLLCRSLTKSGFSLKDLLTTHWVGVIFALALTASTFISVEPKYRTLSDETNLIAVSKSMFYDQTILNSRMGRWFNDEYHSISSEIPSRPLLFSFGVQIIHQLLGYSSINGFVFNGLVVVALLLSAYLLVYPFIGAVGGVATMLLILAQPIVALSGTSSGFDLFSSLITGITFVVLFYFVKSPSADRFALLWITLLLLLNSRYECAVYLFVIVLSLLALRIIRFQYVKDYLPIFLVSLFFFLPYAWQMLLIDRELLQNSTGVERIFALSYLKDHIVRLARAVSGPHVPVALTAQDTTTMAYPYAAVLVWIGALVLAGLAHWFLKNRSRLQAYHRHFVYILAVALVMHTVTVLSFWSGWPDHPSTARYYLNVMILFSVMPAIGVAIYKWNPGLLLGLALLAFICYHPKASYSRFYNTLVVNREVLLIQEFISSLNRQQILVVSQKPDPHTVMNVGSVSFNYANDNLNSLHTDWSTHLYEDIYVVQVIEFATKRPAPGNSIRKEFELETLREILFSPLHYMKFSRVKSVRSADPLLSPH